MSQKELVEKTNCVPKCLTRHFEFKKTSEKTVSWKRKWSSAFYLYLEDTSIEREEEFWVFDMNALINGIGEVLGIFIGWSFLDIIEMIIIAIKKIQTYFCFN